MSILSEVNNHEDLLCLTDDEKIKLCGEIREFLVENVAKTGGHLSGNLGTVELSVALETVFDTRKDRLVFDVGHQSYVHKILTGRKEQFSGLRQFGGISGFPKPSESETDAFVAGHASSSISIALGMARARTLQNQKYNVVALIGDGAMTGGMAYEALNDVAVSKEPMVIILNDNEMSIRENVGGLSLHLSRIRSSKKYLGTKQWYRRTIKKLPGGEKIYRFSSKMKNRVKRFLMPTTLFENMGITYLGPVDGHDLAGIMYLLRVAKDTREPVLLHVVTKKGYGYKPAELNPAKFHGIGKFDAATGEPLAKKVPTFSDSFGEAMVQLGREEEKLCAITAAMPDGTGLQKYMKRFPQRTFDVGIAEEHAVSMAGGLAKQGMIPVVALYSTFLQRAYDQIMQDISMLHLHVVLAIDRAGLVGDDGPTHHGVFDVGFLRQIPGMTILAPASLAEQKDMLTWAVKHYDGPVAIRYPRGGEGSRKESCWRVDGSLNDHVKVCTCRSGEDVTLLAYGMMIDNVLEAAELLNEKGIHASVLRLMSLGKLPVAEILEKMPSKKLIVAEEICHGSGIAEALAGEIGKARPDCSVYGIDLGDDFVVHGNIKQLHKLSGLDAQSIANFTEGVLHNEK